MKASLRPYLPSDARALIEIFRSSIEELTQDDYGVEQREAWASAADDEVAFAARLAGALTILALVDGEPVGFISLNGADEIDLLYVHPDHAGQGVGTMLLDAIEKIAGARGAATLLTNASDTARSFFEKRAYVPQSRNTISIGGEWLANTLLKKQLAANGNARGATS